MATATLKRRPAGKTRRNVLERANGTIGKIDRERGVIRGVKILGRVSKNGHTYSERALRQGASLYEGAKIYVDHPANRNAEMERSVSDLIGVLENVVLKPDGLYADAGLLTSHPKFQTVMEIAERRPDLIGFSHNSVVGETVKDGKTVYDEIIRVRSCDLVTSPATTRSLFESATDGADATTMDVDTYSPSGSSSDDAVEQYFKAAVNAVAFGDGSIAERLAKIRVLLKKRDAILGKTVTDVEESRRERRQPGRNTLESGRIVRRVIPAFRTQAELAAWTKELSYGG